jgi:hypothetical protein
VSEFLCINKKLYAIVKERKKNRHGLPVITKPHQNNGGGERVRTDDLLRARQALSQLSYTPNRICYVIVTIEYLFFQTNFQLSFIMVLVGLDGVEPSTSRLSGVRSNQTELQAPYNFGSQIAD